MFGSSIATEVSEAVGVSALLEIMGSAETFGAGSRSAGELESSSAKVGAIVEITNAKSVSATRREKNFVKRLSEFMRLDKRSLRRKRNSSNDMR